MAEDHQDIPVASVEPGDSPRIVYVKTVKDRNIYKLVVFSFGLLCFLQVALNISLLQTFCEFVYISGLQEFSIGLKTQELNVIVFVAAGFNRTDQKIQLGLIFCFYDAESGHNSLNLTALTDTTKEQIADVCPSVYYISTSRKSWHESRKDCLERGADLLIINSQEEQKFMIQFKRPFWIGLIYAAREKEWKWIDGTLLNTSFWNPGEPNNYRSNDEDCVETLLFDSVNGWNDKNCGHQNFWICEWKLQL